MRCATGPRSAWDGRSCGCRDVAVRVTFRPPRKRGSMCDHAARASLRPRKRRYGGRSAGAQAPQRDRRHRRILPAGRADARLRGADAGLGARLLSRLRAHRRVVRPVPVDPLAPVRPRDRGVPQQHHRRRGALCGVLARDRPQCRARYLGAGAGGAAAAGGRAAAPRPQGRHHRDDAAHRLRHRGRNAHAGAASRRRAGDAAALAADQPRGCGAFHRDDPPDLSPPPRPRGTAHRRRAEGLRTASRQHPARRHRGAAETRRVPDRRSVPRGHRAVRGYRELHRLRGGAPARTSGGDAQPRVLRL